MVFIYHWLLWRRERYDVLIQTFSSIIPHNKEGDYTTDYLLYHDRTSQHSPIRQTPSEATMCGRRDHYTSSEFKMAVRVTGFLFSFLFCISLFFVQFWITDLHHQTTMNSSITQQSLLLNRFECHSELNKECLLNSFRFATLDWAKRMYSNKSFKCKFNKMAYLGVSK